MRTSFSYVALNELMISELEAVWQAAAPALSEVTPLPLRGSRPPEHPLGNADCRRSSYYQVCCENNRVFVSVLLRITPASAHVILTANATGSPLEYIISSNILSDPTDDTEFIFQLLSRHILLYEGDSDQTMHRHTPPPHNPFAIPLNRLVSVNQKQVTTTLPLQAQQMRLQSFCNLHKQRVPKKCIHVLRDVIYVKCLYIFLAPSVLLHITL